MANDWISLSGLKRDYFERVLLNMGPICGEGMRAEEDTLVRFGFT